MQNHDWFYRVYDNNTSATEFGAFAPYIKIWQSKLTSSLGADWLDFGVDDLVPWYKRLSLAEVEQDFSNMTFRLWGTELTELWGADYTGRVFADNQFPEHWQTIEQPYIEKVVKLSAIGVCGGTLHLIDREFINITYVDLAVSRAGKKPYLMSAYLRDADRTRMERQNPVYQFIEKYEAASNWRDV